MSDVPPRPRIRPATSDDWQKDQSERAGLSPSPGQEPIRSAADFDGSTYYEYLEKHTDDVPVSRDRHRNAL
ncbi:MAG: protein kinase, partial [Brevibacterium sp.]|nr:protein kinase [Brevibacterium sp.]